MADKWVRTFGGRCWHVADPDGIHGVVYTECGRDFTARQLEHAEAGERPRPVCEACGRRLWLRLLARITPSP